MWNEVTADDVRRYLRQNRCAAVLRPGTPLVEQEQKLERISISIDRVELEDGMVLTAIQDSIPLEGQVSFIRCCLVWLAESGLTRVREGVHVLGSLCIMCNYCCGLCVGELLLPGKQYVVHNCVVESHAWQHIVHHLWGCRCIHVPTTMQSLRYYASCTPHQLVTNLTLGWSTTQAHRLMAICEPFMQLAANNLTQQPCTGLTSLASLCQEAATCAAGNHLHCDFSNNAEYVHADIIDYARFVAQTHHSCV
jgi:hypothetical protein